jgi:flagellum-specific peptidoglycan hydrolase FlgJ
MKKNILPPLLALLLAASFLSLHNPAPPDRPWKVESYIKKYKYLAVELNKNTGIPLPIILAVAGLESDWGTSELAKYSNNHFGIKAVDWPGLTYCKSTWEYINGEMKVMDQCFRKYLFIKDSYTDFGEFLKNRKYYKNLFVIPQENLEDWAHGMWYCKYATDPDYGFKIMKQIDDYRLKEIIQ